MVPFLIIIYTLLDSFLQHKQVYTATIRDSLLGLGFVQDGACLYDLNTGELRHISREYGLQDNTVHGMMFGTEGNLWLALNNGIDYIELNSSIFSLHGGSSLIGSGYASCVFQNKLYLGTNRGVYVTHFPVEPENGAKMEFIEGSSGQVWSFLEYNQQLFCASDNGVFLLEGNRLTWVPGTSRVRCLVSLPHQEDVLIAGTYGVDKGLYVLCKQQGSWQLGHKIQHCDMSCKSLLAESSTYLWMTNKNRGVSRLLLSDDLREVRQLRNYNDFPMDYDAQLSRVNQEIVVASHYGLWRFHQQKDCLVRYTELEQRFGITSGYTFLQEDEYRNLWCASGGVLKLLRYDAGLQGYLPSYESFLNGALIENFETVTVADSHAVIGTEDGFSYLELLSPSDRKQQPFLQIRHVYVIGQKDSLIYGRSFQYHDKRVQVPFRHNSLRIECSVSKRTFLQPIQFSYQLCRGGDEGEWSDYTANPVKEFTNLAEGSYTFRVRLLADFLETPVVTSFQFEVLPPWYRTWWSYLGYMLLTACVIYFMYRRVVRSKKLLLMQKELELYHQHQAFAEERALKNRQIHRLEDEKLQADLRHKSEELVRTTPRLFHLKQSL